MTNNARKIPQQIKEQDRQSLKQWKPYAGPPDWNFIVLDAPKKELENKGTRSRRRAMDEDVLARLNDSQNRDRILLEFNRENLDDSAPNGGEQGMNVIHEMNDIADLESRPWFYLRNLTD